MSHLKFALQNLAKAHNRDRKFSPKGPWKFKNTVLLEIRISQKKTA